MDQNHVLVLASSVFSLAFFGCGAAQENIESETETIEIENAAHTGGLGFHVWTTLPGGGCSMIGADVSLGRASARGDAESRCSDDLYKLDFNFTVQVRYINFVNNVHYTCGDSGPVHSGASGYANNWAFATQTNTSGVCARVPGRIFHAAVLVQFKLPSGASYSSGWQNTSYATY